jgi:hypothetical protein
LGVTGTSPLSLFLLSVCPQLTRPLPWALQGSQQGQLQVCRLNRAAVVTIRYCSPLHPSFKWRRESLALRPRRRIVLLAISSVPKALRWG